MNLRLALYALAARYDLSPQQSAQLRELSGLDAEPVAGARWLPRLVAILAAALVGFGIILWLAANWADLGRMTKFALLEGLTLVTVCGAALRTAARAPLLLLALLAQGGTLAFFGQTYQTGADPWQLFALWAGLALPLALAARSDALWVPLAVVAVTAIALWTYAHTGRSWSLREEVAMLHLAGWFMALAVALLLGPLAGVRRLTGAGPWSFRAAVTLAVILIAVTALSALFSVRIQAHYALGLLVLAGTGFAMVVVGLRDVLALSVIALALDTLLIGGLARLLLEQADTDWTARLFLLGLAAAGLVAATVTLVRRLLPRDAERGGNAP